MSSTSILQINTGRSRASVDVALVLADQRGIDVLCITEPPQLRNGVITGTPGWCQITNDNASILYRNSATNASPVNLAQSKFTVGINVGDLLISSTYAPPNQITDTPFGEIRRIASQKRKMLITGDFNCRTRWTTGLPMRQRDDDFEDLVLQMGLKIENSSSPTLHHQGRYSINDYTLSRGCNVTQWEVLADEESFSDHKFVHFQVQNATLGKKKWVSKKLDVSKFRDSITNVDLEDSGLSAEEDAAFLTEYLVSRMDQCTVEKEIESRVYWWTPELEAMKRGIRGLRREKHRTNNALKIADLTRKIKEARLTLRNEIGRSKVRKWREFTGLSTPWGRPYKLVVKGTGGSGAPPHLKKDDGGVTRNVTEAEDYLLRTKFPENGPAVPPRGVDFAQSLAPVNVDPEEVITALKKSSNRSTPGPDRANYKILKVFNKKHPTVLASLFDKCLNTGVFPGSWKTGRVAWVPKAGKDTSLPGSYRPITLLSVIGKTFERVICERLNSEVTLSEKQFGFRKRISAEECLHEVLGEIRRRRTVHQYTAMVALDIKGAFDYISWPHTLTELASRRVSQYLQEIIRDYLRDRCVQNSDGSVKKTLTCGCPQGSVLSPLLWNVGYDCVLNLMEERGVYGVAYADDTLLLLSGRTKAEVTSKAEEAIDLVMTKFKELHLELNVGKTEIVVFGSVVQQDPIQITLHIGTEEIKSASKMKYLGIIIDYRLQWTDHLQYLEEKANRILPKILSICQNTFGYSTRARKVMLNGTIGAYYRYGVTCYAHTLLEKAARKSTSDVHGRMTKCIGRLYRTASYLGSCAITGQPPLVLDLISRAIMTCLQKGWRPYWGPFERIPENTSLSSHLNSELRRVWQRWWADSPYSAWTRSLIPEVSYTDFECDFFLSQALSGHGCFRAFLKKIGKLDDGMCPACNTEETAAHVLEDCIRFSRHRPVRINWREEESRTFMRETVRELWTLEQTEQRARRAGNVSFSRIRGVD